MNVLPSCGINASFRGPIRERISAKGNVLENSMHHDNRAVTKDSRDIASDEIVYLRHIVCKIENNFLSLSCYVYVHRCMTGQ